MRWGFQRQGGDINHQLKAAMNEFQFDTPGVFYDAPGVAYDGSSSGLKNNRMQVVLKLYEYTPLELVQLTGEIVSAMSGNPAFQTPNPPLTALTAAANTVAEKIDAYEAARNAAAVALAERDSAIATLSDLLETEAEFVGNVAGDDPAIVYSAGMGLRAPRTPAPPMPPPANLRVFFTDAPGTLELRWDPVRRVRNYTVEMHEDPLSDTGWIVLPDPRTPARRIVTGLVTGRKYWFRVRANGVKDSGPASDPVCRIAP